MDPLLYTYHIPRHEPEMVARNVVRQHVAEHLLRKRAGTRLQKDANRTAQERLADAWEQLETEAIAPGSALGTLDPEQLLALEGLLKRGRTLAFRALNLHREPTLDVR